METEFATAMRRALDATRAMNLDEATATIQAALAGQYQAAAPAAPARQPTPFSLIDPAADDAEVVEEAQDNSAQEVRGPEPQPRPPFSVLEPKADPSAAFRRGRADRSLREVVEALRRGRPDGLSLPAAGRASAPPAVPEGARYETRRHDSPFGSRDYRLYVPARLPERPQGLVIMLHGCTQNPDDFATGTGMNEVAEQHGLIVAYPAQTAQHNPSACWNWFRPGDQSRDLGEPAILSSLTQALAAEFAVPQNRIFVAGLSAGGAMAAVMGAAYPDLYAAVGVHSGLAAGSARDILSAFAAMRGEIPAAGTATPVPTIAFHGRADTTVHPANAERLFRTVGHSTAEHGTSGGGRAYTRTTVLGAVPGELWLIDGSGHAWSGGSADGSYTDPAGPDASAEMVRFFLDGGR